ncbi:hypothetical protein VBD025_16280 [Virgibacillus flavescens]|uniref:hypothetical protein n=1 Tax=Virgibacillus flavescens TaxID=1611422 RepID=UPI003D33E175
MGKMLKKNVVRVVVGSIALTALVIGLGVSTFSASPELELSPKELQNENMSEEEMERMVERDKKRAEKELERMKKEAPEKYEQIMSQNH